MTVNKFLKIWIIVFVLFFSSTVIINYFIDPYLLYNVQRVEGINNIKPTAGRHSNQSKIHTAHKQKLDVLIIGNSRPEMGIDPDHPYFKKNKLKVYNLGLPGSSISTQYGYAIDIMRTKKIKLVLIAVDFMDFITSEDNKSDPYMWPPQRTQNDNRRKFNWNGSDNPNYFSQYLKDIYVPLIALGTLSDSLTTLFSQRRNSSNLLNNGFNPAEDMHATTLNEGVKVLFDQKIPQLITSFTSQNWKTYTPGYQWSPSFNTLQFLLNYLRTEGIETKVFINPYHMKYLEAIEHAGLGEEFSLWKIQLTKTVAKTSENNKITLWNFSDPGIYISEAFLNAGKKPLKWFWEPAHYRKELGDKMINIMLRNQNQGMKSNDQFGHILTLENIDSYIAEYPRKFQKWERLHPDEAEFIKIY